MFLRIFKACAYTYPFYVIKIIRDAQLAAKPAEEEEHHEK